MMADNDGVEAKISGWSGGSRVGTGSVWESWGCEGVRCRAGHLQAYMTGNGG